MIFYIKSTGFESEINVKMGDNGRTENTINFSDVLCTIKIPNIIKILPVYSGIDIGTKTEYGFP